MIILLVLLFIFIHNCIIWLWYRNTNNPSVIDVGWASALTLSGLIYLNHTAWTTRSLVLGLALAIWGIRLGGYLWVTRIRKKIIDKRYITLSENWKIAKPLGFFLNYQLQGMLIFVISLPWYFTALNTSPDLLPLDMLGLIVFVFAMTFETIADSQLSQFRKKFPGRVCNQKLWYYSRHPNYFFEWLVWCAFTIFAFSQAYGWVSILSPLTLYLIMTKLTGPLTEEGSILSKGKEYLDYQALTPMFFPFRMRSAIIAAIILILVTAVSVGPIMSRVEQAKYHVIEQDGSIEMREYAPMVLAEVEVSGDRKTAINNGFRLIADYIFGNNRSQMNVAMTAPVTQQLSEKIAMTAPVLQKATGSERWKVNFVMPSSYTIKTLPKPINNAVKLIEVPAKRYMVIRFSGIADQKRLVEQQEKLEKFIKERGLITIGAPIYAFFNPPWTLPIFRRNEVMIEIK